MRPTIEELKDRSPSKDKELESSDKWYDDCSFRLISGMDQLHAYLSEAREAEIVSTDLETSSLNSETGIIAGVSMACNRHEGVYIPINHKRDKHLNLNQHLVWPVLQDFFNVVQMLLFFNGKFDVSWFEDHGIKVGRWEDASVSCFMLNTNRKTLGLKHMSQVVLGRKMLELEDVLGTGTKDKDFTLVSPSEGFKYAGGDALNTLEIHEALKPVRDEQPVIYKIETAAAEATRIMERNRVLIDVPYCKRMWEYLDQELRHVKAEIFELAKKTFDIDSPKQCGTILFDDMKIPNQAPKKEKTGQYDTSADHLVKLQNHHPICSLILTARSLAKSRSTYVERLIEAGEADSRGAKFCFHNLRVPTGRMASGSGGDNSGYAEVNAQAIPANYSAKVVKAKKILSREGQKVKVVSVPVGRQFLWNDISLEDLVQVAVEELRLILKQVKSEAPTLLPVKTPEPVPLVDQGTQQAAPVAASPNPDRVFLFEELPDSEVAHLVVGEKSMPTQQEADSFLGQLDETAGAPPPKEVVKSQDLLSQISPAPEAQPAPSIVDDLVKLSAGTAGSVSPSNISLDEFMASPLPPPASHKQEPLPALPQIKQQVITKPQASHEVSIDDLLPSDKPSPTSAVTPPVPTVQPISSPAAPPPPKPVAKDPLQSLIDSL